MGQTNTMQGIVAIVASWSGKLNEAGGARQPPAIDKLDGRPKKYCYNCCKLLEFDCKYLDCKACNQMYFCNTVTRHDVLCQSIIQLKQLQRNEVFHQGSYQTACSMKDKPKVVKLVGVKCMSQCRKSNRNITGIVCLKTKTNVINLN